MYDKNKMAICKHSSYFHSLFALLSITAYTQGKISQFKENSISPMVVEKLFYGLDMIKEHRRVVRSAGSGDSNQPTSTNREFDNPNHNQAVLHWSGKKSDIMFMLTRRMEYNGSVHDSVTYRSKDYGSTFDRVDEEIRGKNSSIVITSYYVSPVNPDRLLFVASNERFIYKTEDEGKNFSPCSKTPLEFTPDYLLFHPTDSDKILAYDFYRNLLYVSVDFCANWILVSRHVSPSLKWGIPDKNGHTDVIYAEVEDIESGGYHIRSFKPKYGEEKSSSDMDIGLIDVDSFLLLGKYIFVQKSTSLDTTLYVSYDGGEFKKAYFPLDQHPLDFTIVNADEDQVFLLASHKEGHSNLYLSDKTGQFYTKSLDNVVAINLMGRGVIGDVYEVESVRGTYLVNQHTSGNPRTLITHNMGGFWSPLPVPENSPPCKEKCSLHLHLETSGIYHNRAMPTSDKNAPGLILAHGLVDSELKTEESSLFISRDGGLSWKATELHGDFTHNILDQGGVIVLVNRTGKNKQRDLWYSFDEGDNWSKFQSTPQHIEVDGVLNEPGINTLIVSLFGHLEKSGWIVVKVNFSTALTTKCSADDYEPFVPSFEIGSKHNCLLGQIVTYTRQKQGAKCYNGKNYTHPNNTSSCDCIDEDYECDYGYTQEDCDSFESCSKKPCTKASWFDPEKPVGMCNEGEPYQQSKGYRKVASDHCTEKNLPDKYKTVEKTCPTLAPADMKLEVLGGQIISRGTEITFQLLQNEGSKKSTKYEWEVPGYAKETITGFSSGRTYSKPIHEHGRKEVKVKASNTAGSSVASIVIYVEERLTGVEVLTPYGATADYPVEFRAMAIQSDGSADTDDVDIHYVWDFGETAFDVLNKPLLTWNSSVNYTYSNPGNYTVKVQAVNRLGTKFTSFEVHVYGTLVTVMLSFTEYVDELNSGTEMWRQMFADYVKKAVIQVLKVDPRKLEVVTVPGTLTRVAVSLLPDSQGITEDKDLYYLADSLVQLVNKKGLKIELDENSFGRDELISATSATIVNRGNSDAAAKSRKVAWIAVPVAIIIIIVAVLIFFYYKRKLRGLGPRYRLLQSNSARPDDSSDGLLDQEENNLDDDDEPMLDPSQQPTGHRLAFGDSDDPLGVVIGGRGHGDIGVRT